MVPHLARRESGAAPAARRSRPGRRPRLACEFRPPPSTWSEAAGRFGHIVKCTHLAPGELAPQPQSHFIRGPGEIRAHPASGELGAATRTATHPTARPSVKCVRIRLAVSVEPAPATRHSPPRWALTLALRVRPSRYTRSEAAGRLGHFVKCARILRPVIWSPQPDAFARGRRSDGARGGHSCKTAMG
jgi:hypothetical protein